MKTELIKYIKLIEDFVNGIITVQEFEKDYLSIVKEETFMFNEDVGKILEKLFSDVDSYCGNPEIANYDSSDPFADIDERELKRRANDALVQLGKFVK